MKDIHTVATMQSSQSQEDMAHVEARRQCTVLRLSQGMYHSFAAAVGR
jgi:hypothetical protein